VTLALDAKQQWVVDDVMRGKHQGGVLLAGLPGSGKTNVAAAITMLHDVDVVLLVCPVKGTRIGWTNTFKRAGYTGEFFMLDLANRENFERLKNGDPGIYILGREYLIAAATKRGQREALIEWPKVKTIDIAIYDENHSVQNRKGSSFREWKRVKPKVLKIAMSGTWFGNKFSGAWAVTRALWPHLIDLSFWRWAETYAEVYDAPTKYNPEVGDYDTVHTAGAERTPGAFVKTLPAYYIWEADLPEGDPANADTNQFSLFVELSPKHRKAYSQMEDDALTWLAGNPLQAQLPVSKRTRLRQIALAYPSVEYTGEVDEDGTPKARVWFEPNAVSAKIDAFNEYLEDHPDENMLVGTDSKIFADILQGRLKANVTLWTGDTKPSERERILETWGQGPEREVLVATIPSLAEGVDGFQHVCSTLVWMNKSTNPLLNTQFLGRLRRRGQRSIVTEVEIIAVETEDTPDNNRIAVSHKNRLASQGKENVL